MNHLAHTFLAFEYDTLLVGTYVADMIPNHQLDQFGKEFRKGIMLHRHIDTFTDQHPLFKESTRLLHRDMGKYAPVVLDIYYDYLLSKHWTIFSETILSAYCQDIYSRLLAYKEMMPEHVKRKLERMISDCWLERYQTYHDLDRAYNFLGRRAKFRTDFTNASGVLLKLEPPLEERFLVFFPEVINWVKDQILKLKLET